MKVSIISSQIKAQIRHKNIMPKSSCISANLKNFTKNLIDKLPNIQKDEKSLTVPYSEQPIVVYMSTKKENIGKKLVDEVGKANQYYTNNYNDSVKALNDIGIKSNYEKYINSTTGRLNQTGLNAQKAAEKAAEKAAKEAAEKAAKEKKNGVSHRGRQQNAESSELEVDNTTETQDSLQTNGISDKGFQNNDKLPDVNHETTIPETNTHKIPISELPEDASYEELLNVDVSLPPELQEIADMPVGMGDPDLMSDIMADLPEGFAADSDLWASLKDLVGGVLDMMG